MIISHDEVIKCMGIIAVEASASPSVGITPAGRVYAEIFKKRFREEAGKPSARAAEVKKAFDDDDYYIESDDIAEKIIGRVISDKVR